MEFLKELIDQCSDGDFKSMESKYQCAHLLTSLSSDAVRAREILKCVGIEKVQDWVITLFPL
jgi:hypothetical protein